MGNQNNRQAKGRKLNRNPWPWETAIGRDGFKCREGRRASFWFNRLTLNIEYQLNSVKANSEDSVPRPLSAAQTMQESVGIWIFFLLLTSSLWSSNLMYCSSKEVFPASRQAQPSGPAPHMWLTLKHKQLHTSQTDTCLILWLGSEVTLKGFHSKLLETKTYSGMCWCFSLGLDSVPIWSCPTLTQPKHFSAWHFIESGPPE